MKKAVIVTDVWSKNINGVVTAIVYTKKGLEDHGYQVTIIHPGLFHSLPLPSYAEIRLAIFTKKRIGEMLRQIKPDYIHIATEGPLGLAARTACVKRKWQFTTSYHTRFPEYITARIHLKPVEKIAWEYLRWFHSRSKKVMVSTPSLKKELEKMRFKNVTVLPFGVELDLFKKNLKAKIPKSLQKPIFTFLGRIAPEKNLKAFLECDLPGTKLIIGDGPQRKKLERKFKEHTVFVGKKKGQDIVDLLSISDVFVFPSKTDTFGLVLTEALACELPVAAYNVHGPKDIITNGKDGFLGNNLAKNAIKCLDLNKENCRKKALKYSWDNFTNKFIKNIVHV
ncbi:MAG: glycosyltransferase family 1 protein [Candidatus Gracilibacteria bacterium]